MINRLQLAHEIGCRFDASVPNIRGRWDYTQATVAGNFDLLAIADALRSKHAILELPEPMWERGESGEAHPEFPHADYLFRAGGTTVEVDGVSIVIHGPTVPEWASGAAHGFRDGGSAFRLMAAILAAARAARQTETADEA